MTDFWTAPGFHLLTRDADNHLAVTPDFLRAYLLRPEMRPPEEACDAERTLHAALLDDPARSVPAPLLDAIADHADMLVRGEDSQFLNKLALATGAPPEPETPAKPAKPAKPAGQSHIRQARGAGPKPLPATGPMADMLKKLFGAKDD